jgi:Fe-S-cluster-containing hydrogenase component 2
MITIDEARCTGCGVCLSLCPQEAIVLEEGTAEIRQDLCSGCGICISSCPQGAIREADLVPVTRLPARPDREAAVTLSSGGSERAAARARRLEVIRPSPSALERRRAVAGAAVAIGPVALKLLARLAERWATRPSFREPVTGGRDFVGRGPGGGRRRRWRGGRCS